MTRQSPSYVDTYIALDTLSRLADDGATLVISYDRSEQRFEIACYGWPFEQGPAVSAVRDVPRRFDGSDPRAAPCVCYSPKLSEAIENALDAYRDARMPAKSDDASP